jgi:hypothetical protein
MSSSVHSDSGISGSGDSKKVQSLVGPRLAVVWPSILGWQSHNVCAPLDSQRAAGGCLDCREPLRNRDARVEPNGYRGRVCVCG